MPQQSILFTVPRERAWCPWRFLCFSFPIRGVNLTKAFLNLKHPFSPVHSNAFILLTSHLFLKLYWNKSTEVKWFCGSKKNDLYFWCLVQYSNKKYILDLCENMWNHKNILNFLNCIRVCFIGWLFLHLPVLYLPKFLYLPKLLYV